MTYTSQHALLYAVHFSVQSAEQENMAGHIMHHCTTNTAYTNMYHTAKGRNTAVLCKKHW